MNKVIDLKSDIEIMVHEYDLVAYNEEILSYKYVKNSLPIKKNIKHLDNLKFDCEVTYKKRQIYIMDEFIKSNIFYFVYIYNLI